MTSASTPAQAHENLRLRALLDALPDGLLVVANDRVRYANQRAAELVGAETPVSLLGRQLSELVPESDRQGLQSYIETSSGAELTSFDMKLRRDDASFIDVALRAAPFEYQDEAAIQIVLRDITERKRAEDERDELLRRVRDLYAAQQEEAEVSAALARVGRELIPELNTPAILHRLCQLTTELLHCDNSQTVAEDEQGTFSIVSSYGLSPDEWEALRLLRVPRSAMTELIDRLDRDKLLQIEMPTAASAAMHPQHHPAHQLPGEYGITYTMYVQLERGDSRFAYQAARRRGSTQPFTPAQERLFSGLARLACLALQNAQLVERLERADRFKAEFLATMSHELRTPLGVIIGYNDLLLDGAFGATVREQDDALRRVGANARQLYELVTATLDMSRVDSQPITLDVRDVDLAALLSEIAEEIGARPRDPAVRLRFPDNPNLQPLPTDRSKLKIVLSNLVSNALKFTRQGEVNVRVRQREKSVEFQVRDTGCGIPPEALDQIFEPFRQLQSAEGNTSGVGLGLYIVKRLTTALGGTVGVSSVPGVGSEFRITVPRRLPSALRHTTR